MCHIGLIPLLALSLIADGPVRHAATIGGERDDRLGAILERQGYTPVPLMPDAAGTIFTLKATVGDEQLLLCLDTGGDTHFALRHDALKRLGIDVEPPPMKPESGRHVTSFTADVGKIRDVTFAGSKYAIKTDCVVDMIGGKLGTRMVFDVVTGKVSQIRLDGVLGQRFLHAHSAVIDGPNAVLYLKPRADCLYPIWGGRWQCTKTIRDGKEIPNVNSSGFTVLQDLSVEIDDHGKSIVGVLEVTPCGPRNLFIINAKDDGRPTTNWMMGIYKLKGDTLTLCLLDNALPTDATARFQDWLPKEFAAEPGSGYTLRTFVRQPATKPAVKSP